MTSKCTFDKGKRVTFEIRDREVPIEEPKIPGNYNSKKEDMVHEKETDFSGFGDSCFSDDITLGLWGNR